MASYREEDMAEKPQWDVPERIDAVRDFFADSEYDAIATHMDTPGKDLITVEDEDRMTITWEGDDRFCYVQDGEHGHLDEDDDLYGVAEDLMAIYDSGLRLDDDLRERAAMMSHANSPELSYALNEPMEWGLENDARHWNDAKKGPIEKIKDLLGS